jgi:hypothetical protein
MGTHSSQTLDVTLLGERDETVRDIPLGAPGPIGIITKDSRLKMKTHLNMIEGIQAKILHEMGLQTQLLIVNFVVEIQD